MFTLLAIALIGLLLLSFNVYSAIREKQVVQRRVETMDSFLHALEQTLNKQAYIAGFRIIFLADSKIIENGAYISNMQDFMNEAFFNGTVSGVNVSLMNGITYNGIVDSLNDKASKINVNVTLADTNISMTQEDPWNVKFTISTNFVMTDRQGLARWNKTQNSSGIISIINFEDPVYVKNSNGLSKKINRTIYEGHYNSSGNLANLSLHFQRGYYTNNSIAPSFLKRLSGDLSSDPNGIETFVDTSLLDESIKNKFDSTRTKTVVDYIYFNTAISTPGYTVTGMPAIFRIDDGHKPIYQLT
jgi:hypothetical protein